MAKVFVQGASRGIGLQFCRHILHSRSQSIVFASCRNPDKSSELLELQNKYSGRLRILCLDVTNERDIKSAADMVAAKEDGLDLLINSAGVLHPSGRGETSLRSVTAEGLMTTLQINTVGPLLMAKHFASVLAKGNGAFGAETNGKKHSGVLINMSAKVGSTTLNALGGWYSYRLSKAALNMATKNLGIELGRGRNKVICISLHPGTVDTDLSRPYHQGVPSGQLFSTEHSVQCLMKIIENAKLEDSGKFINWDGSVLEY